MPSGKKQETGEESSVSTQEPEPETATPHKEPEAEPKIRDV
jgi:hypothetical protein